MEFILWSHVDNTGHCSKDRTPVDMSQGFHKCQNSFYVLWLLVILKPLLTNIHETQGNLTKMFMSVIYRVAVNKQWTFKLHEKFVSKLV